MKMFYWLIVAAVVVFVPLSAAHPFQKAAPQASCGYASCNPVVADKLNVHMIPHSHDDVGWLKTVDQLYYGSRTDLQRAGVQYILDSVVKELPADPSRKFIYVETAFLWQWWKEQTEEKRNEFRALVNSGQLEIVNGAWSMNDEGATNYLSIIDNFTWGLRVLNDTLGECGRPTTGWQIDTFGHSREHASISARMGFDGIFFARLDYQDRAKRLAEKSAEMIWRGSPDNLGETSDIFTHAFPAGVYSPPPDFCFDVTCGDDPLVDNPDSPEYNIPARVKAIVDFAKNQATMYRSNNVLLTMGDDFNYQEANFWYKNLDKLIKYVNADNASNVNLIYSTPSCYLKAVNDEGLEWPEKTDDFLPFATDPQVYWSGYFTSKPTLKYFERLGNNILQVTKQLLALAGSSEQDEEGLTQLREAMGVLQHHDAITGTMKDPVGEDYSRILDSAITAATVAAEAAVNKLMGNNGPTLVPVIYCLKLNISECAASEVPGNFVITVYNPLSRTVSRHVRVPVTGPDLYQVQYANGPILEAQLIDIPSAVLKVPGRNSAATYELGFQAERLPPLGFQSFYVNQLATQSIKGPSETGTPTNRVNIGSGEIAVQFDDSGLMNSVSINGIGLSLAHTFEYYYGYNSNAYIFHPNFGPDELKITSYKVVRTAVTEEVHQEFEGGWASQVIRVYTEENYVEFEWMIGPIPDDGVNGKDVVSKFTTDLDTNGTFYTDSNGRELLKRVRNFRPTWDVDTSEPFGSNYYPVTSKLLVRDEAKNLEVALLVDRAQGGSSLQDGEMELMLHRRLNKDLQEEPYGQGVVARGKHWLVAGPIGSTPYGQTSSSTPAKERLLESSKLLQPWIFISPINGLDQPGWAAAYNTEYSGLTGSGLPRNVQILTLEPWTENTLLLRLEHILEVNEDDELSKPATVDLSTAFAHLKINSAVEMTLGGNQLLENLNRLQWNSEVKRIRKTKENKALDITAITLNPMEIRTFVVDYTRL